MNRRIVTIGLGALVALGPLGFAACSTGNAKATDRRQPSPLTSPHRGR